MKTRTDHVHILRDAEGHPAFAVLPYSDYQALKQGKPKSEPTIPNHVVNAVFDKEISATKAWRLYLELTQAEVAGRMGITQGAFAQLEGKKNLRKSSREKIAQALGIKQEQLDF